MPRRRTPRDLLRSERGTILALWGVSIVAIFGMVALSFDLGRIGITQTDLQGFVDNVALAAAGELDRKADAIERAEAAAASLIADTKTFGSGDAELAGAADFTLFFYETLPDSDADPLTDAVTDPREANFVRAVATTSTVDMTFAAAFAAMTGTDGPQNVVRAEAVAGFTLYTCEVTHVMFCLPDPGFRAEDHVGEMILLRTGGNGAAWGAGNFGFIDPKHILVDEGGPCAGLTGSKLDICLLGAAGQLTRCYPQQGVDTSPGQSVGIMDAVFNLRFDIYHATVNNLSNDPDYAPAPNVIKGLAPKKPGNGGGQGGGQGNGPVCLKNASSESPDTVGLPRDDCFAGGGCDRFGDGDWSVGRVTYVNTNYDGVDPHPGATTRWDYYKAEIAAAGGPGSQSPILTGKSETGRPQCAPAAWPDPERRLIVGAGIDCAANPVQGSATNLPVQQYFELFITEPVGDEGGVSSDKDFWVEIVGPAGDGGGGAPAGASFHDVVQLYR